MSYDSYAYILGLLERAEMKLEDDFHVACSFIPSEGYSSLRKSGTEKAHDVFTKHWTKISVARREFQRVAKMAYKDHPNPKMREFWCS